MMVTFISQCEKKALKRTRRVLDAFANRIGDNTWQTVITEDGLLTVKKMLRQTASKSTAVSCHWIRSRSRSQFLWVVGSRDKFNSEGIVPVNYTEKSITYDERYHTATPIITLFSQLAGYFHDIGKSNLLFQEKIDPGYSGKAFEPYRHEWVSLRLFQAFVGDLRDTQWLSKLAEIDNSAEDHLLRDLEHFKDGITEIPKKPFKNLPPLARVVAWLIVSHHKLPQYPKQGSNPPSLEKIDCWLDDLFEACWNSPQCLNNDWDNKTIEKNWSFPLGTPLKSAFWQNYVSSCAKQILNTPQILEQNWFSQLYVLHLSRLSLMLADHFYSSKKNVTEKWQDRNYKAFANTDVDENRAKFLKQKLDEHNIGVGENAAKITCNLPLLKFELPNLSGKKVFEKRVPKEFKKDYGWQDNAFDLAASLSETSENFGFFGINMASTGKGKTRANARIMYGLSGKDNCRFSVALGLRTLTLQTGKALKRDLMLSDAELAVLVGSQAVRDLHQQDYVPSSSEKADQGCESAESLLKDEIRLEEDLPKYEGVLSHWFEHDPRILKLIQTPVLISTIDYLIPACDGIRGGRQIAPMLRLLTSDLVLDEPDDFGLADLPALCRLVNWAGMLGSKVLLSTATLSPAQASALFCAYQAGRLQYTQVNGEKGKIDEICCAWFDEFKKPRSALITNQNTFDRYHSNFISERIAGLSGEKLILRKAKLIAVEGEGKPSEVMAKVIFNSARELHINNGISVGEKRVSLGLVRIANINPLVAIAKTLLSTPAPSNTRIHYCIYHSHFPLVQRSFIERKLDAALTRHDFDTWCEQSEIEKKISRYKEKHHIFIVLASPVAEVGRDHDYDWGIVEPSSMRSIIQIAGRIQRHRKQEPEKENIYILSKNIKGLQGVVPSFEKPGFETIKRCFSSRDLIDLVEPNELCEVNAIPRIQAPNTLNLTKSNPQKFNRFYELEHVSQKLCLFGNKNMKNHASIWWLHNVTWSAEVQRSQAFRYSPVVNDDFRLTLNRENKFIWQKKITNKYPPFFQNTNDIARNESELKIESGNHVWIDFNLRDELGQMTKVVVGQLKSDCEKFTHISLPQINKSADDKWLYHSLLGVFKNMKMDRNEND